MCAKNTGKSREPCYVVRYCQYSHGRVTDERIIVHPDSADIWKKSTEADLKPIHSHQHNSQPKSVYVFTPWLLVNLTQANTNYDAEILRCAYRFLQFHS